MPFFRNRIIDIGRVREFARGSGEFGAFTSLHLYSDDVCRYVKGNLRKGRASISGYDGKVFSNYLFFDIDGHDLSHAQSVARRLASFFYRRLKVPEHGVTIAYSGNRGYHIGVDSRVFGQLKPSKGFNRVYGNIREKVPAEAGLYGKDVGIIDYSISDKTRLWRLVNTKHEKSGLYKIQIGPAELFDCSQDEIRDLARSGRPVLYTDETGLVPRWHVQATDRAEGLYRSAVKEEKRKQARIERMRDRYPGGLPEQGFCKARDTLYHSHVSKGKRNSSALILASAFRSVGDTEHEAMGKLKGWNDGYDIGLPQSEIRTIVRSAYRGEGYRFGCKSLAEWCPVGGDYGRCGEGKYIISF